MRITENCPERLVLKEQTVWISVICAIAALLLLLQSLARHHLSGLVGVGLFMLLGVISLRASRIEFDRQARVATLEKLKVLARKSARITFDEINDVVIETDALADHMSLLCRLALRVGSSAEPLTDSYSAGYAKHVAMRITILELLGRPVSETLDISVRQLVRSRRTIDAVTLLRTQKQLDLSTARHEVLQLQRELEGSKARL